MYMVKKAGAIFLIICMLVSLVPVGIAAEDLNLQITKTNFNLKLKDGNAEKTEVLVSRDGNPDASATLQVQVENDSVAKVGFEASFPDTYGDAYGILTVTPVGIGTTTVNITAASGIDTAVGTLNVTVEADEVDTENCIFVGSSEEIFSGTFAEACDEARKAEVPEEKKVRIKGKVGTYGTANIGGIMLEGYTEDREENILITTQDSSHDSATGDGHDTGTGGSHDTGTAQADTVVRNLTVDANHYVNCPLRFMYDNVLVENVIVQHGVRAGINLAMSNSAEAKNMTFKNVLARDNRDCGFLLDCVGNAEGVVFENCRAENNYNLDCTGSELNGVILTNMYGDTYDLDMSGITVAEGTFSVEDRLVYGEGQTDTPSGDERPQSKNRISWLQPPVDEAGNPVDTQTARYYNAGKYSGFQYGGSVAGRTVYVNVRGRSYSQERDTFVYYPDNMAGVNTDLREGEVIRGQHSAYRFTAEGPSVIRQNQQVQGSVTLSNDTVEEAGYAKVRIKVEVVAKPEGAEDPQILANDGKQDYDLVKEGYWGPAEGFSLAPEYSATTPLRLTFANPGSYRIKYSLINIENYNAVITEAVTDFTVQAAAFEFIAEGPSVVRQDETNIGSVTLKGSEGNEAGYSNARIKIELLSKPEGAAIPELIANDGNKDYDLLEIGYWGPASGFEITPDYHATTPLKATFYDPGEYTIKYSLVDVSNEEAVITEKTDTITVQAVKYAFTSAVPEAVKQNQETAGSVTLASQEGNEASFEKVRIKVEVLEKPEGAALPKIIANDGKQDYDLAQTGYWGPENGFALPASYSATTPLKVTFADPGSYSIQYSLVDLEREAAVIARQTIMVEVQKVKIELTPQIIIEDDTYNAATHPAQVQFLGVQPVPAAYIIKYKKSTEENYSEIAPSQAGEYTAKLFLTEEGEASYILSEAVQKDFSILPREVVLTYNEAVTKEYDASGRAILEETKIGIQNIAGGDAVAISGVLANQPVYADAGVGENKTVTVQTEGLLLNNSNYKLPAVFTLLGNITAKQVQIGLLQQKTRTYGDEADIFTVEDFELKNNSQFAGTDQLSDFFGALDITSMGLAKQANASDGIYPLMFGEQSIQPDNYQITLELSNGVLVKKRDTKLLFQPAEGLVYKNDTYIPQQLAANAVLYPADGPDAQKAIPAEEYTLDYDVRQQGQDAIEIKNAGSYQIQLSAGVKDGNYNAPSAAEWQGVTIEKAVLSAILIEHEPEKMKYISEAEKFDPAGSIITAVYNDGTPYRFVKDVTAAAIVSAPEHAKNSAKLTLEDHGQQVEFTYGEADINIIEAEKTARTTNILTVEEKPVIATVAPLEDITVTLKADESLSGQFTAQANVAEPETYDIVYQWYQAETDTPMQGENQASLTIPVTMANDGSQYYCTIVVTAEGYTPFTARTNTAVLSVQKGSQEAPQVQVQQPVAAGGDGSLTITGRAGAFIGIYSDAECENKVGKSILLDQNGKGSAALDPGSYYIRCEETEELNAGAASGPYTIKNCYSITYNKGHFEGAGELSSEAPQSYLDGEEIDLTGVAYASSPDTVVQNGWFTSTGSYHDAVITGAAGDLTVTAAWQVQVPVTAKAVAGEIELEADFSVQPAVLIYEDTLNQGLTASEVLVQAPAAIGDYKFMGWRQTITGIQMDGEGNFLGDTNQTAYQPPRMKAVDGSSAVLLTAVYEKITSKITAPVAEHGSYTYTIGGGSPVPAGQDRDAIKAGETISVSLTPDLHYRVDSVTVQETSGSGLVTVTKQQDGTYSFVMPSYHITLTVQFAPEPAVSPTVIPTTDPTNSPTIPPVEIPTTSPTAGPTTPPTTSPTTSPAPRPESAVHTEDIIRENGMVSGTVAVSVDQVLPEQQAADILVGIYKNDTLVFVCKRSELLQQGSNQVSIDFNIQGADDGDYMIKAFIWDSAEILSPVTEVATGRIE
jgi:hypothetical protein